MRNFKALVSSFIQFLNAGLADPAPSREGLPIEMPEEPYPPGSMEQSVQAQQASLFEPGELVVPEEPPSADNAVELSHLPSPPTGFVPLASLSPQAGEGSKKPFSLAGRGVGERGLTVLQDGSDLNSTVSFSACACSGLVFQEGPDELKVPEEPLEPEKKVLPGGTAEAHGIAAAFAKMSSIVIAKTFPVLDVLEEAESLHSLAQEFASQGHYLQSEKLYQRSLAIREKSLGPSHPKVAESLHFLALVCVKKGLYSKAETLFKRSLSIREQAFGSDHPKVAESLCELASVLATTGRYSKAESLYQRSLAIREKSVDANLQMRQVTAENVALLHSFQKTFGK